MTYLRAVLAGVAVFVAALALLVWFMPARLALGLMQSRLHGLQWEQVGGSLWDGQAGQVSTADGAALGQLHWTLSRRALLGDVRFGMDLRQPQLQLQAQMQRISDTQENWHDVDLHADMAMLGMQPLLAGQPQGQLDLHITHMLLQGQWPMQADASGSWSHAAVRTTQGTVALGRLRLVVQAEAGVLKATLDDDGSGPLRTAGRLSVSPLGWELQLDMKPRRDDPALLHWLRGFGHPAADGSVQVRYRGGLAQLNPATGHP
ncbi:type II secretion system protein N [Dyella acidiphila]|uniref:Type II secretion system protein N n=1 Tax=Dyella acidiphila TaxID=2775866 RepID=A0ABR9G950_9GAMM|nr:type II secretion system protein N [Dyella acidiphila]MBE1160570.1 type II secretion system protein N [Dyella acidiphila]